MRERRWIVLIKIIAQHNSGHTGKRTTKLKSHVYIVSAEFTQASLLDFFFVFVYLLLLFFCILHLIAWIGIWHSEASFLFTLLNNWNSSLFSKPHEESWVISYPVLEANQIVKLVKVLTLRLKYWRVGSSLLRFIDCPMPLSQLKEHKHSLYISSAWQFRQWITNIQLE